MVVFRHASIDTRSTVSKVSVSNLVFPGPWLFSDMLSKLTINGENTPDFLRLNVSVLPDERALHSPCRELFEPVYRWSAINVFLFLICEHSINDL